MTLHLRDILVWTLALSLTVAGFDRAQADATVPGEIGQRATPAVWKVEAFEKSSANRGAIYLMGSIHVGPVGGWRLSPKLLETLDGADHLVVEVDEKNESAEDRDDVVLVYAMFPVGETLKDHISPALYTDLRAYLKKVDRPINGLDQLRPWMVAVSLMVNELHHLGYPTDEGLDIDLMKRERGKKPIIALETAKQQLTLLDEMSPSLQEMMLRDALEQTQGIGDYFKELIAAWRNGDTSRLEELLFRELERTPELAPFYERVIFERNETMHASLEKMLESGKSYFVVVGAAHLVGERGIVARLKSQGRSVSKLDSGW